MPDDTPSWERGDEWCTCGALQAVKAYCEKLVRACYFSTSLADTRSFTGTEDYPEPPESEQDKFRAQVRV